MTLGERIKEYRIKNNYTQEYLGNYFHYTRQNISKWEQNKSVPSQEDIEKLAELFNISVDELLGVESKSVKKKNIFESRKFKILLISCASLITSAIVVLVIALSISKNRNTNDNSVPNIQPISYDEGFYICKDTNINLEYNGDLSIFYENYSFYFEKDGVIKSNIYECNNIKPSNIDIFLNAYNIYFLYKVAYSEKTNKYESYLIDQLYNANDVSVEIGDNKVNLISTYGVKKINIYCYDGLNLISTESFTSSNDKIEVNASFAIVELILVNGTKKTNNIITSSDLNYCFFNKTEITSEKIHVELK